MVDNQHFKDMKHFKFLLNMCLLPACICPFVDGIYSELDRPCVSTIVSHVQLMSNCVIDCNKHNNKNITPNFERKGFVCLITFSITKNMLCN